MREDGTVVHSEDHYPYGMPLPGRMGGMGSDGVEAGKPRYTGHEREDDLDEGVYYAGARYYDGVIARWMSVDPKEELFPSQSPYNYVFNNPMNWVDPDGECPDCTDEETASVEGLYWQYRSGNYSLDQIAAMFGDRQYMADYFNQIAREQAYLEAMNTPVGALFAAAVQEGGLSMEGLADLSRLRTDAYNQTKGTYMMMGAADAVELSAMYFFGMAGGLRTPRSFGLAGGSSTESVTLFRAVSEAEFAQIAKTGRFQAFGGAEGKYFAETAAHAARWGEAMMGQGNFRVVRAQFPKNVADQFYRWEKLDGIGPARFAQMNQLTQYRIFR